MDGIPANHRLAERKLIQFVRSGEWRVDDAGRIWKKNGARAEKVLPSGYLMMRRMKEGFRIVGLAHRLVWQHLYGDIPPGMVVNHKNGLKDDNRPSNLEILSMSENKAHSYRGGLSDQYGEKNPAAKLTDNQVAQIRLAYSQGGYTMEQLAVRFGVHFQHVSRLIRGQRRIKQGGPTASSDLRFQASSRDPVSGRFVQGAAILANVKPQDSAEIKGRIE